jgi:membrane-associated phospholipid phosphatase
MTTKRVRLKRWFFWSAAAGVDKSGAQALTSVPANEIEAIHAQNSFLLWMWWGWIRSVLFLFSGIVSRNRVKTISLILVSLGLCVFVLSPWEPQWLHLVSEWRGMADLAWARDLAVVLSEYGDFVGFNGTLWLVIYGLALVRRSRFLRLMMLGSVLGTVLTGGTVNVLRPLVGRARPSARVAPGFYGPQLSARYHSFPSGHTATAFGGAVPLVVMMPKVGVPLLAVAGSVAWSRLYNRAHHPTDVFYSIILSIALGVPLGLAVRRVARQSDSEPKDPPN